MKVKVLHIVIGLLLSASLFKGQGLADSLKVHKRNLEIHHQKGDKIELCKDYNQIANIYGSLGDYQKAIDNYYKGLKLAETTGDKKSIGFINFNIGQNYLNMDEVDASIPYIEKAMEVLSWNPEYDQVIGDCYNMLGAIYHSKQDYKNAELTYYLAIERFKEKNNKAFLANVYVNLADMLVDLGKYKEAKENARYALNLFRRHGDTLGIAVAYINIQVAHFFANEGNKKALIECVKFLDSALIAIKDVESPEHHLKIYENKADLYEQIGNADSAHKYLKRFTLLKDSLYGIEKQNQIQELRVKFESERKEKENLLLEKEVEILAAGTEKRNLIIILTITAAALAVSILLLVIVRNNSRKKQKEIEHERSTLELEQKTLRAQMNPHFLFNAINSIQRFILKKNQQEAYDYLAKFSKLIRTVLHNSQEKVLMLSQELDMIRLYVEMEQLRFDNSFEFKMTVSDEVDENETPVPAMLIQPYIENAIWHGLMNLENERKGVLRLDVCLNQGMLQITIKDNGIGRAKAGTYNKDEKHKSVGMKLTEQRLLMINKMQEFGSAKVEVTDLYNTNKESEGTRVVINLPMEVEHSSLHYKAIDEK